MRRLLLAAVALCFPGVTYGQFTAPAMLSASPTGGVTPPPPACTGTNYFVSAAGNNANAGTSIGAPWQTISKVNAPPAPFVPGNCINWRGGDNFSGNLVFDSGTNVSGGSPGNPIIVRSYGVGNATITSAASGFDTQTFVVNNVNGLNAQFLTIRPSGGAGGTTRGVDIQGSTSGTFSNLDVGGFTTTVTIDAATNVRISSSGTVTFTKSVVHGLSGPGSGDDTGIQINGNSGTLVVSDTEIYDIGSRSLGNTLGGFIGNGLLLDNTGSGTATIERMKIHDIGGNTTGCGGPSGILVYSTTIPHIIQDNEVYFVRPLTLTGIVNRCDYDGIDEDGGTSNGTVRRNYVHDNFGTGIVGFMNAGNTGVWGPHEFYDNIMQNNFYNPTAGMGGGQNYWGNFSFQQKGVLGIARAYNNTMINTVNGSNNFVLVTDTSGAVLGPGSSFFNNMSYATGGANMMVCHQASLGNMTSKSNAWFTTGSFVMGQTCSGGPWNSLGAWQAAVPGGDTNATQANPTLVGTPPLTAPCTWTPSASTGPQPCPTGAQLSQGSTYVGVGVTPASQGASTPSTDYYGNTVPNSVGTGWNIGAYGATGSFFIAPSGNDANPCTIGSPCRTFAHAQTLMRSSGTKQTVARGGTYTFTTALALDTADSGTSYVGFTGETAIIDGASTAATAITIGNPGHVTNISIVNLTIQNFTQTGIDAQQIAGLTITNNTFQNLTSPDTNHACVYLHYDLANVTVSHNLCQNNTGPGFVLSIGQPDPGMSGFYTLDRNIALNTSTGFSDTGALYVFDPSHTFSLANPCSITNNIVGNYGQAPYTNTQGKGIYLDDDVSFCTVTGNQIWGNGQYGIQYHGGDHNIVSNNVFDITGASQLAFYQDSSFETGGMVGNTFTNNIVYSSAASPSFLWNYNIGAHTGTPANPNNTNNLYFNTLGAFSNKGSATGGITDTNPTTGNPLFTNAAAHNYQLGGGSPALSAPVSFTPLVTNQGPQ